MQQGVSDLLFAALVLNQKHSSAADGRKCKTTCTEKFLFLFICKSVVGVNINIYRETIYLLGWPHFLTGNLWGVLHKLVNIMRRLSKRRGKDEIII